MNGDELPRLVTLLTDFGATDPFVGIMKGVMLREEPRLRIIDVTHGVGAQDIGAAAFVLGHSFGWFPAGSVHVGVVDPGVGGARAVLVAEASGHYFVAPDNGLLSEVLAGDAGALVRRADVERLGLSPRSRTFHGRDVFAPLAAWLASGRRAFAELGELHAPVRLDLPRAVRDADGVQGRIVLVDHFGNLISNVPSSELEGEATDAGARGLLALRVEVGGLALRGVGTYSEAEPGECVGLVSSFGTLEIAERNGSAARSLGLGSGARIHAVRRVER